MSQKASSGKDAIIIGTVMAVNDPTFTGRIKVKVPGYNDNIPTEKLPWCSYGGATVFSGNGGGNISIPRVGQLVRVQFKSGEATSMEWTAINALDPDLINELKNDYQGSQVLLYDSGSDLSVKYQPTTGFIIYYKGSFVQFAPDNSITIHYGEGATGTQIQLSDERVDIQSGGEINLTTTGKINLEADSITLNAKSGVNIAGSVAGECAVNGAKLMTALLMLAENADLKAPQTAGQSTGYINAMKEGLLNQAITYFKP